MDSTYAPQSPDLSSFLPLSSPSKTQQPYQPHSTSYAPRSPIIPSFNSEQPLQPHHHPPHNFQHLPYQQQHPPQQDFSLGGPGEFEYGTNPYMPPIPALPPAHSSFGASQPSAYYPHHQVETEDPYDYKHHPPYDADGDNSYVPTPTMSRDPRTSASSLPPSTSFAPPQPPPARKNPNPNNIEIRTKFPVARIKRIMQADEEVGKVAQVTPVAVSKALELFMISLVSGAAEKAREKGGKRVTAQHLKMVVQADEQFDFLSEIVGKVADGVEAGGEKRKKGKVEDSDSEEEKKGRKGKGRRKKGDD